MILTEADLQTVCNAIKLAVTSPDVDSAKSRDMMAFLRTIAPEAASTVSALAGADLPPPLPDEMLANGGATPIMAFALETARSSSRSDIAALHTRLDRLLAELAEREAEADEFTRLVARLAQ